MYDKYLWSKIEKWFIYFLATYMIYYVVERPNMPHGWFISGISFYWSISYTNHTYVPINIYHLFIHSFVSCYNSAGGLGDLTAIFLTLSRAEVFTYPIKMQKMAFNVDNIICIGSFIFINKSKPFSSFLWEKPTQLVY